VNEPLELGQVLAVLAFRRRHVQIEAQHRNLFAAELDQVGQFADRDEVISARAGGRAQLLHQRLVVGFRNSSIRTTSVCGLYAA